MPEAGTTAAAISLGSNMGDRLAILREAVRHLEGLGALVAVSPVYETAPVGPVDQAPFYNAVAVVDTGLDAAVVVARLLEIEADLGRVRGRRWGPRTIDLDLILHGRTVIETPSVWVPHPRYQQRRFVIEPLLAAWPDARDPDGTSVADLFHGVADQEVHRVAVPGWQATERGQIGLGMAHAPRGGR